jgi:type I restriction enzyme S subunit
MSDIPDIPIAVPPIGEQRAILACVGVEVARQESATERLGRQIALLDDHRQALITAAVTGELDVPGMAA